MQQETPPDPRNESLAERDDRNLAELLQELRVAGLGVQVLFGFLLSLPFTTKFSKLSQAQRELYLASLVLAAVSWPPRRRHCCSDRSPTTGWCSASIRRSAWCGRPASWRCSAWPPWAWRYRPLSSW